MGSGADDNKEKDSWFSWSERFKKASENNGGSTPSQYAIPGGATDLQDLIEHRKMNFAQGNIFKAAYRMNHCGHSNPVRDLNKIIWFAKRELARIAKEAE